MFPAGLRARGRWFALGLSSKHGDSDVSGVGSGEGFCGVGRTAAKPASLPPATRWFGHQLSSRGPSYRSHAINATYRAGWTFRRCAAYNALSPFLTQGRRHCPDGFWLLGAWLTPNGGERESNSPVHHLRHLWANPLFVCVPARLKRRQDTVSIASYRCGMRIRKSSQLVGGSHSRKRISFDAQRSTWLRAVPVEGTRARTSLRRVGIAIRGDIGGSRHRSRAGGGRFGARKFAVAHRSTLATAHCATALRLIPVRLNVASQNDQQAPEDARLKAGGAPRGSPQTRVID